MDGERSPAVEISPIVKLAITKGAVSFYCRWAQNAEMFDECVAPDAEDVINALDHIGITWPTDAEVALFEYAFQCELIREGWPRVSATP